MGTDVECCLMFVFFKDLLEDSQLIHAKVPILRMRFKDTDYSDIMVDLNANNSVAIKNTVMMFYYATCECS